MSFETLLAFLRDHPQLVAIALFVLAMGESIIFTSLFIPATASFLAIGALHQAAGGAFWPIALAGAAGAFAGDLLSYVVARYFKDDLPRWWPFHKNPTWIPMAERFLSKWGALGLIGSKFVGPVRAVAPAMCGALQMPFARFVVVTAVACMLWSLILLGPSYYGLQAVTG